MQVFPFGFVYMFMFTFIVLDIYYNLFLCFIDCGKTVSALEKPILNSSKTLFIGTSW